MSVINTAFCCKGGEQVTKVGGLRPLTVIIVRLWAYAHGPPRGVWGHAPPKNFGNFDSLRAFLMHSGSSFWTDLASSNFYLSTVANI